MIQRILLRIWEIGYRPTPANIWSYFRKRTYYLRLPVINLAIFISWQTISNLTILSVGLESIFVINKDLELLKMQSTSIAEKFFLLLTGAMAYSVCGKVSYCFMLAPWMNSWSNWMRCILMIYSRYAARSLAIVPENSEVLLADSAPLKVQGMDELASNEKLSISKAAPHHRRI